MERLLKTILIVTGLGLLNFTPLSESLAQSRATDMTKLYQKIKNSVVILSDNKLTLYGIYLASPRKGHYSYVASLSNISIGIENQIICQVLGDSPKKYKIELVSENNDFGMAVFKIHVAHKNLLPLTRIPDKKIDKTISYWALGHPASPEQLVNLKILGYSSKNMLVQLSDDLSKTFIGSPIFDDEGRLLGCITRKIKLTKIEDQKKYQNSCAAVTISALVDFATYALAGSDLYPLWQEVYPTQYTVDRVKECVALLDTKKSGAGIFLGTDKLKAGYILTAHHVVEDEDSQFSVQFFKCDEENLLGMKMPETIDTELDLAIVKVENCPTVKPAIFIRTRDLERLEQVFSPNNIGNIGYDHAAVSWGRKFGALTKITDKTIETNLPLQMGDSGGPVFNKNAEIIGINLKTEEIKGEQQSLAIANNSRTILQYLEDHLKNIDFVEQWGFHYYPSWWTKNKSWFIPTGIGAFATAVSVLIYEPPPEPEKLAGHPVFPEIP